MANINRVKLDADNKNIMVCTLKRTDTKGTFLISLESSLSKKWDLLLLFFETISWS